MNKKELGLVLADRMNLTQVEAKRLTNALFDILMEEISSGVSVKISGFGSFYLRPKLRGFVPKKDRIPSWENIEGLCGGKGWGAERLCTIREYITKLFGTFTDE